MPHERARSSIRARVVPTILEYLGANEDPWSLVSPDFLAVLQLTWNSELPDYPMNIELGSKGYKAVCPTKSCHWDYIGTDSYFKVGAMYL